MRLSEFNTLSKSDAVDLLLACAQVDRWAREIVGRRPYESVEALVEAVDECANPWSDDEIDSALERHPRIGERAQGDDSDAEMSRQEQLGLGIDADIQRRLDAGNAAYEEKFGFVFLIRAAGRSAEEILLALTERMNNTPEQERHIAADQLRQIAALRLEGMMSSMVSFITTHVLDAQAGRPATGIDVELERLVDHAWSPVASGTTDDDGRIGDLGPDTLPSGTYRITFDTGSYFAKHNTATFYPEVSITFAIDAEELHYHVPILLSPFAYSTYRGS